MRSRNARRRWGVKHAAIGVCRVEPCPTQRANRSRAWLGSTRSGKSTPCVTGKASRAWLDSTGDACLAWRRLSQKSIVADTRSEEHTSELQSQSNLVCRLLLEKKKKKNKREHIERMPVIINE